MTQMLLVTVGHLS